jgi:hypothetical protein
MNKEFKTVMLTFWTEWPHPFSLKAGDCYIDIVRLLCAFEGMVAPEHMSSAGLDIENDKTAFCQKFYRSPAPCAMGLEIPRSRAQVEF